MVNIELLSVNDILEIHNEAIESFGGSCFVDGNKRVGFYAAVILLKINGFSDYTDDDEAYDKAIQITCSQLIGNDLDVYINELSDWLEERFVN